MATINLQVTKLKVIFHKIFYTMFNLQNLNY